MIVSELRGYIERQGSASRIELAKQFSLSEDGVEAMMQIWVKRGKVTRLVDMSKTQCVIGVRYRANSAESIPLTVTL